MIRTPLKYLILSISIFLLVACDGEKRKSKGNHQVDDSSHVASTIQTSNQARIITLPTPMQIPALLKNTKASYDPTRLMPIVTDEKSYAKTGILFGMYMLDLAYSSSFTHKQSSINYFHTCRRLADDLGLGVKITEKFLDRFEKNATNPDSLGRIILQMYDLGHKVLLDQEKEGLGFLMVMGCYMEGMNLIMHQARKHDLILFVHLLHQQRNYGMNLSSMLEEYEIPGEINTEYSHFTEVVKLLNSTNIPTVYELKSGKKTIAGMNSKNLEKIKEHIDAFSRSIVI